MAVDAAENEGAVQLDQIGQIALTVSDLGRSVKFYKDTLGMTFLFDAGTMAFFQCGDIRFMIGLNEGQAASAGSILYFKVGDIEAIHAALQTRGVAFTQAPHMVARMPGHDLWLAEMKDPDGNPLALMSEVPRG